VVPIPVERAREGLLFPDAAAPADPRAEAVADETGEQAATHPGPARAAPRSVSEAHLKGIIESLVFVSDKPLTAGEIARIARAETWDVRRLLDELRHEYRGRGLQLDEIAGGWQFRSSAANAPFVRELLQAKPVKLTRAQVETLAILAYRQPITRPEIDEIRGVDSGSALKVLLDRDLIRMLGRKEDVGRPVLYGTSGHFLEFFGLKSLRELPTLREFTDLTPESEATLVRELGETDEPAEGTAPSAEPSAEPSAPAPSPEGTPGEGAAH
jgi:segregation and condensation protein B